MTTDAGTPEVPTEDPIAKQFADLFPSLVLAAGRNAAGETLITVPSTEAAYIVRQAHEKPEFAYDFLRCITATDQEKDGIEIVYSLLSLARRHTLHVKTLLSAAEPVVDSITPFWLGADWHEREAMEMLGITFIGHPNPKNLLLDDDMEIHPLLKAHPLAAIELKQGYQTF
jgi:NADH-quinone oxidoreductase subunit C